MQYTYKQTENGYLLLSGEVPVSVYPTLEQINRHAKMVTGKDAKPYGEEPSPQPAQPEARPRGRPKKVADK